MAGLLVALLLAVAAPANWLFFRNVPTGNAVISGSLSVRWNAVTGGPISASPTTDGQILYVGNNAGYLDAIELQTGRILWTRHLRNAVMTAPLLYDGLVIVGEGDEMSTGSTPATVFVGIGPSAMDAFDAHASTTRWHVALAGSAMTTPAIIDGVLVHLNGAGWFTALDPSTGQKLYSRNLQSLSSMSASIPVGGSLFITSGVLDNAVWKLKAPDGATVWRTPFPPESSGIGDCPPVTDGSRVFCDYIMPVAGKTYTIAGDKAVEYAYALDLKTGAKLWNAPLETGVLPPRNEAAIPLLYGNRLYLGSSIVAEMHAIDPASGHVIWQMHSHGVVKGAPVAVSGVLYFGDLGGYLWALNASTGEVIGDKKMPSGFNVGSPIVVGRTLVIGSRTGSVYALPVDDIRSSHDP